MATECYLLVSFVENMFSSSSFVEIDTYNITSTSLSFVCPYVFFYFLLRTGCLCIIFYFIFLIYYYFLVYATNG